MKYHTTRITIMTATVDISSIPQKAKLKVQLMIKTLKVWSMPDQFQD